MTRISGRAFLFLLPALIVSTAAGQQRPPSPEEVRNALRTLEGRPVAIADGEESVKCGLPAITRGLRNRAFLPPEELHALNILAVRPESQMSLVLHGFRFHFDTSGIHEPALLNGLHQRIAGSARAYVDSAASMLSHVAEVETTVLGYSAPPPDDLLGGGPEYDVYIMSLGNTYGYTDVDNPGPEGGTSSTFMTIDSDFSWVTPDSNKGIPALKVTLAHEFFHAIQLGRYGYWTNDRWFYEISSVWMEDVVYTGVNDYYNYLLASWSHFRVPTTPLTSNDVIMYSRGIWGQYIAKAFGNDAMRHTWEQVRLAAPLQAIDNALRLFYGSSFKQAFVEWCTWNARTGYRADPARYYPEGAKFPLVAETAYDVGGGARAVNDQTTGCTASKYFRFTSGSDALFIVFVYTGDDCAGPTATVPLSFSVARSRIDDSYRPTSGNFFVKTNYPSSSSWVYWDLGTLSSPAAFPSPFSPGPGHFMYFPLSSSHGTLSVFTSAMELVFSGDLPAENRLGRTVVSWDGRSNRGEFAASGVYFFVVDTPDKSLTGKFVVIRK
jgi:hypothetical protein